VICREVKLVFQTIGKVMPVAVVKNG